MEPLRVLIVDDEEEFVNPLVERLNLRGFEARGVTTGEKALRLIDGNRFDVVLLDVKMPGLGGLDVIRSIREKHSRLQVILLTGHTSAQDERAGQELGCFEYLIKPVNIDQLVEIFHRACGEKRGDTTR